MSAQILSFPAATARPQDKAIITVHHFSGCPHCGQNDSYLNNGRDHWFFCDRHKTKWLVGSNLFSSWREEDDEVWRLNRFKLAEYMTVNPINA